MTPSDFFIPPAEGRQFGHFQILGRLGAGAMGEVYRARDQELGREVAIKFLPPRFASDPERLRRFANEARAASSLNHPNIVTIHEVGEAEGCPYIVMECVEGKTLREIMNGARPPVKKILEIAAQIAEGLAKAHSAGIVHRDLKPENVMVTRDGFAKILDFGLAKLKTGLADDLGQKPLEEAETVQSSGTSQGTILGTVGYMSPEQAAGREVDYRSDQFGLGAILYEMAAGRRAFHRDSVAQTLAAIIEEDPQPLGELNAAFPAPARWIIERCLAKLPGDRYASTLDLARELRGVREHIDEASSSGARIAAPPSAGARLRSLWKWAAIILAVATLMLGLPAVSDFVREKLQWLPLPAEKRLAVLPVHNPGGTADDRATCDGLHSYVVAHLVELERFHGALWVVPAAEVRRAGSTGDADAGRILGATLAIDITVQRVNNEILMTASLFDAARSRGLRAATRRISGDASLLDQTVDAVVGMLDLELGDEARKSLRAGTTSVVEASTLYAQALAHKPYEQARNALEQYAQRKSLEQAVMLFNAALERDPRYALARAGLGEAYLRLYGITRDPEHVALAEKHSQRAIEMDPLVAEAWLTLGHLHAQTGKPEEALADFKRAEARAPKDANIFRERASALGSLGHFKEAESNYLEAIRLRPDAWSTLNYYGRFLTLQGRPKEAETILRRALEVAPDNARVWSNLGAMLSNDGRIEEAKAALRKSIAIQPTGGAVSNLASREYYEGRFEEAARGYAQAAQLSPLDYRFQNNLASALLQLPGERQRAVEEYRKTYELAGREFQLNPKDSAARATMAESLVQTGDGPQARKLIEEALRLGPLTGYLASRAAGVYEDLGDRVAALKWLDTAFRNGHPRTDVDRSPNFRRLREDPRYANLGPPASKPSEVKQP